jgi:hypothetical protein
MGGLVIRVGIIGLSEGNGHPFSFSAILNGYSDQGLQAAGWKVIYDYVKRRDQAEFGVNDMRVTHAWTQDSGQTEKLCRACLIPNAVSKRDEMLGQVDAVVIARDDFENHFDFAMPFLEAGLPVLIDKPLSVDLQQLRAFKPYLERAQLMSCSGMRFARELDEPRASIKEYGELKLIRGAVVLSWEKYGVHLLDAIFNVTPARPVSISVLPAPHASFAMEMSDGSLLQVDALGNCPKTFRVDIWGDKVTSSHDMTDNFSMFRRMLWHFDQMIQTQRPVVPPQDTIDVMRTLIAGRIASVQKRPVLLHEIQL